MTGYCVECGVHLENIAREGRRYELVRGYRQPIPSYFSIPTCPKCGEEFLSASAARALEKILRAQLASTIKSWVNTIERKHGTSLQKIERACRVTNSYLSHVLAGRRLPSGMLVELIRQFVEVPGAFEHAMSKECEWDIFVEISREELRNFNRAVSGTRVVKNIDGWEIEFRIGEGCVTSWVEGILYQNGHEVCRKISDDNNILCIWDFEFVKVEVRCAAG